MFPVRCTSPVLMDCWKGAISVAASFKTRVGSLSGPLALDGLKSAEQFNYTIVVNMDIGHVWVGAIG